MPKGTKDIIETFMNEQNWKGWITSLWKVEITAMTATNMDLWGSPAA